ncbi:MAG TPA: Crp/Fnr family transcriptional regulator [Candidatus Saccharimonadales bacterium]|nr:Crp/Fnr family transcriptional regulator [Candidatus Saccharimonadales bacterium]
MPEVPSFIQLPSTEVVQALTHESWGEKRGINKQIPRKGVLFREGENIRRAHLITSGLVMGTRKHDGRAVRSLFVPGDVIGLEAFRDPSAIHVSTGKALRDTEVVSFPIGELPHMMMHEKDVLEEGENAVLFDYFGRTMERMTHEAEERWHIKTFGFSINMAAFTLHKLAHVPDDEGHLQGVSQEVIAQASGITRETLIRAPFPYLTEREIITFVPDYHTTPITIHQPKELLGVAYDFDEAKKWLALKALSEKNNKAEK